MSWDSEVESLKRKAAVDNGSHVLVNQGGGWCMVRDERQQVGKAGKRTRYSERDSCVRLIMCTTSMPVAELWRFSAVCESCTILLAHFSLCSKANRSSDLSACVSISSDHGNTSQRLGYLAYGIAMISPRIYVWGAVCTSDKGNICIFSPRVLGIH